MTKRLSILACGVVACGLCAVARADWTPEQIDTLLMFSETSAYSNETTAMLLPQVVDSVQASAAATVRLRQRLDEVYWFAWAIAFVELFNIGWRAYELVTSHSRTAADVGVGRV